MSYHLLDIPSSLTPSSFIPLKPASSVPPNQPRNPPAPDIPWPQAEDLEQIHGMYGEEVEQALKAAHEDGVKEWYQPRIQLNDDNDNDIRQWHEMFAIMDSFGRKDERDMILLSSKDSNQFRLEELRGEIISNPHSERKSLSILLDPPQTFYIPAGSSFILDTFPSASTALAFYTLNTSRFDLIILDPPWHNKAVSRLKSKKQLSYNTMKSTLTELPPVGNWLLPGGIIGIWCTNNLKIINQVKTILFKRWSVELIAEWVWLKVTSHGEPVVSLTSSFRKPYEILLIARKISKELVAAIPERKVIIAVPGYHSQKPCLKGIFDEIFPVGYRACELYSRNLVEGWMSVGDECVKFMRDDYWTIPPNVDTIDERAHDKTDAD